MDDETLVLNEYLAKYNFVPKMPVHLIAFSKQQPSLPILNYGQAKHAINSYNNRNISNYKIDNNQSITRRSTTPMKPLPKIPTKPLPTENIINRRTSINTTTTTTTTNIINITNTTNTTTKQNQALMTAQNTVCMHKQYKCTKNNLQNKNTVPQSKILKLEVNSLQMDKKNLTEELFLLKQQLQEKEEQALHEMSQRRINEEENKMREQMEQKIENEEENKYREQQMLELQIKVAEEEQLRLKLENEVENLRLRSVSEEQQALKKMSEIVLFNKQLEEEMKANAIENERLKMQSELNLNELKFKVENTEKESELLRFQSKKALEMQMIAEQIVEEQRIETQKLRLEKERNENFLLDQKLHTIKIQNEKLYLEKLQMEKECLLQEAKETIELEKKLREEEKILEEERENIRLKEQKEREELEIELQFERERLEKQRIFEMEVRDRELEMERKRVLLAQKLLESATQNKSVSFATIAEDVEEEVECDAYSSRREGYSSRIHDMNDINEESVEPYETKLGGRAYSASSASASFYYEDDDEYEAVANVDLSYYDTEHRSDDDYVSVDTYDDDYVGEGDGTDDETYESANDLMSYVFRDLQSGKTGGSGKIDISCNISPSLSKKQSVKERERLEKKKKKKERKKKKKKKRKKKKKLSYSAKAAINASTDWDLPAALDIYIPSSPYSETEKIKSKSVRISRKKRTPTAHKKTKSLKSNSSSRRTSLSTSRSENHFKHRSYTTTSPGTPCSPSYGSPQRKKVSVQQKMKQKKKAKEQKNLSRTGFVIRVNHRLRLDDNRIGICKFKGRTLFGKSTEDWIGILVEYGDGEHNGTVKGKQYFRCRMGKGIMVRPCNVIEDIGSTSSKIDKSMIKGSKKVRELLMVCEEERVESVKLLKMKKNKKRESGLSGGYYDPYTDSTLQEWKPPSENELQGYEEDHGTSFLSKKLMYSKTMFKKTKGKKAKKNEI